MPDPAHAAARGAPRPLVLTGYHGAPTAAVLTIATFDAGQRLRRAVQGWLASWGAMVVCVFIPIAHFVLVPALFGVGIWLFFRRLRQAEQVRGAHGVCPDCGTEQDFEIGARIALPAGVRCRDCGRGLTLAEAT